MKPYQKPDDPLSLFSLSIFQMNGLLMRSGDLITRSINQSSARWQVLGRIGHGTQTVAQIARDMGLARQSVQRIADLLTAEALTVYTVHPNDQRTKLIAITEKGKEILAAIYERYAEWNQQLLTKLDPDQLKQIAESLVQIGHVIEEELNCFYLAPTDRKQTEE